MSGSKGPFGNERSVGGEEGVRETCRVCCCEIRKKLENEKE